MSWHQGLVSGSRPPRARRLRFSWADVLQEDSREAATASCTLASSLCAFSLCILSLCILSMHPLSEPEGHITVTAGHRSHSPPRKGESLPGPPDSQTANGKGTATATAQDHSEERAPDPPTARSGARGDGRTRRHSGRLRSRGRTRRQTALAIIQLPFLGSFSSCFRLGKIPRICATPRT